MYKMLLLLILLTSSCVRHPGCDEQLVEESFEIIIAVIPELAEVTERTRVFCSDNVSDACYGDVDSCTIGIGSIIVEGRSAVNNRVPIKNALGHEAMHWFQMLHGLCMEHEEECLWDPYRVEDLQGKK